MKKENGVIRTGFGGAISSECDNTEVIHSDPSFNLEAPKIVAQISVMTESETNLADDSAILIHCFPFSPPSSFPLSNSSLRTS